MMNKIAYSYGTFQEPHFKTDLVHYHLHRNWVFKDWIHPSGLILCCQILTTLWHAFNSLLLGSFEGHLSCIFQQLRASGCAGVMPATVASIASVLASSQPAPMVRKASQPGLKHRCPNNRRGSLWNEPEPVEMQLYVFVAWWSWKSEDGQL